MPRCLKAQNSTVTHESTYPTKEHPSLLTHTGKTVNTPLNSTLSAARYIKVPTNPKEPHYADRHTLASIRKNALTLSFRGHRNGKVPKIEWDQYYLHLLPLVLEHPKLMLAESKQMTDTLRKIYKASSDFIGDASLSAEQQVALKTRSLCLPLLADNPWEPRDDEEESINAIVLEDRGLDAIPAEGSEDRIKHDNLVVQYSRAMSYLREILNHTFLRAVYHTSSRQAKLEYEEVQRNFINDHANDDPDDAPVKFTALDIINYINNECLSTNEKALKSIQNAISKMVRHNNQSLLDWLQSFVAPVNKYLKATAEQALDNEEAKRIWKDHFANQITLSEKSLILLFQIQHLTPWEIGEIEHNRSFMALFEASFPKPGAKECASRMIHAWDEDDICPSCIKPCFFAHECNPNDTQVTQHVPHVRQTIANSQLLHYLQEAHNPHTTHLQASNSVSFNTSVLQREQRRRSISHTSISRRHRNLTE